MHKQASGTGRYGVSLSFDTADAKHLATSRSLFSRSADAYYGEGISRLGTHSNMVTGLFRYVTMYVAFYSSREAQKRLR